MAKQCCACGKRLGFLDSGEKIVPQVNDYLLCTDCNVKKLGLRSARTDEELERKLQIFQPLLANPSTPAPVIEQFNQHIRQASNAINQRHENQQREQHEIEQIKKEGYCFTTDMQTLAEAYQSKVSVYKDKVVIERFGNTSLPADSTIYFRDATAVSWGNKTGRSWISFAIPGASSASATIPANSIHVAYIPYQDPFSIVFGMNQEHLAKKHYSIIKMLFDQFKETAYSAQPSITSIQQDSAVDKLKKLKELKDLGVISDEEYEEKRKKLLSEI